MSFNNKIRELRIEKGLKQSDLAQILKFGRTAISNYESGRSEPSYEVVLKLAEFFNVSIDYILGKSQIRNPYEEIVKKEKSILEEAKDLSPESQKMLEEYIKLLKMKEMIDKNNNETSASRASEL